MAHEDEVPGNLGRRLQKRVEDLEKANSALHKGLVETQMKLGSLAGQVVTLTELLGDIGMKQGWWATPAERIQQYIEVAEKTAKNEKRRVQAVARLRKELENGKAGASVARKEDFGYPEDRTDRISEADRAEARKGHSPQVNAFLADAIEKGVADTADRDAQGDAGPAGGGEEGSGGDPS